MFNVEQVTTYFKEVTGSIKFQLSSAVTFGTALLLVWLKEDNEKKIFLTILFLFPICMFVGTIVERAFSFVRSQVRQRRSWKNLTPEEIMFVSFYIQQNTKTRYVPIFNGTYRDSGIINPLIQKGILYLASSMSEFRGDDFMSKEQHFPINIRDNAFDYYKRQIEMNSLASQEILP